MRRSERGSALIIAVLVMVILTLLGISFLLLAETENRIAENERLSAQALYFAESGARAVIQWFHRPGAPDNLVVPPLDALDRTRRKIDDDGDPSTPPHDQDGATWPRYKQGIDADGDGVDDLFDRPYRFDLRDTLLGTEDGPDVTIDGETEGPGRAFLARLSEGLLAGYPAGDAGVRARIRRIDVYAPPYLRIGGEWTRFGVATVKVIGRIVREATGAEEILAERMVKVVLNEIPYGAPHGPVHSCRRIAWEGPLSAAWGTVTAAEGVDLDADHGRIPSSFPREIPAGTRIDLLWGHNDLAKFAAYRDAVSSARLVVEDPWLRVLAGWDLVHRPPGLTQPHPFAWTPGSPLQSGQFPSHQPGADGTHSNLFQLMSLVGCPELDYDLWKSIATSGQQGVEYYVWDAGDRFRRDGVAPAESFQSITDLDPSDPDRGPAILFFDTSDGFPPHDDDGNGFADNLTPPIQILGGTWSARGLIYLNARSLAATSIAGRPAEVRAPGEPYADANQNGRWDAGEPWLNLAYPAAAGGAFLADAADALQDDGTMGGVAVRNARGPSWTADVAMGGILYTSGSFDVAGPAVHFGSVIAREGITQGNPLAPAAQVFWNEGIRSGEWPPSDWGFPRVVATRWETDL